MLTTKYCRFCNTTKDLSNYNNHPLSKDGKQSKCKDCARIATDKWKKSIVGVICGIYSNQKSNSRERGHTPPTYSKDELREWLSRDWMFNLIHNNWVNCGYQKSMKPSVDRENDNFPYCFSHQLDVMTWGENNKKANRDMRRGKLIHGHNPQRAVMQLTKDEECIKEHPSASQAERVTGISQANISRCCSGKRKAAGGFMWAFA